MYEKLIKEICKEENIDCQTISNDWILVLTKNNQKRYICGYRFPLNDHALGNIIDDKYAFYELCKINDIPIIEYQILWNPNNKLGKNTMELAHHYFEKYSHNVVLKPNIGTEGNNVYHIENLNDLDKKLDKLFKSNFSISICPYYNIESEYRIVVLDNEVKLIFEKIKPVVIGNGKDTIKDLLLKLNYEFFKNIEMPNTYKQILKEGELFEYDWRFNLSKGATARLVSDNALKKHLSSMALEAAKKIKARFVSVDIVKTNDKYHLMEINSGVCINKVCHFIDKDYKITKEIYREAIKKMFLDN